MALRTHWTRGIIETLKLDEEAQGRSQHLYGVDNSLRRRVNNLLCPLNRRLKYMLNIYINQSAIITLHKQGIHVKIIIQSHGWNWLKQFIVPFLTFDRRHHYSSGKLAQICKFALYWGTRVVKILNCIDCWRNHVWVNICKSCSYSILCHMWILTLKKQYTRTILLLTLCIQVIIMTTSISTLVYDFISIKLKH